MHLMRNVDEKCFNGLNLIYETTCIPKISAAFRIEFMRLCRYLCPVLSVANLSYIIPGL